MPNLSFSNKSFERLIRSIRKVLPILATTLLIGVYAVSAISGGMFLSRLMSPLGAGGVVLAYAIGAAIQATRGTLVFFTQLNPTRPSFSLTGEIVAVAMGVISIAEILSLVSAAGLAQPVAISLSILMLAGVGVELYLLREIKFTTEIELYGDKDHWANLKEFYLARQEFKAHLDQLRDLEYKAPTLANDQRQEPRADNITPGVLSAIGAAPGLTGENMQTIRNLILAGVNESDILIVIAQLGAINKHPEPSPPTNGEPIDLAELLTGNGQSNGQHI